MLYISSNQIYFYYIDGFLVVLAFEYTVCDPNLTTSSLFCQHIVYIHRLIVKLFYLFLQECALLGWILLWIHLEHVDPADNTTLTFFKVANIGTMKTQNKGRPLDILEVLVEIGQERSTTWIHIFITMSLVQLLQRISTNTSFLKVHKIESLLFYFGTQENRALWL